MRQTLLLIADMHLHLTGTDDDDDRDRFIVEVYVCPGCWSWQVDPGKAEEYMPAPLERALAEHRTECPPLDRLANEQGVPA